MRRVLLILTTACVLRAAEADAVAISANIQARHTPYGAVLDPIYEEPDGDQVKAYTRCGDSALWTGHYLAAEAFRYKVTRSDDALANVHRTFGAIKGLVDVTGINLLARCMAPIDSPYAESIRQEEVLNVIYENAGAGWIWVGNTSRDQYAGVMFGLAVAYDMVEDEPFRAAVRELVTRLIDYVRGHNWSIQMPNGEITTTFIVRPDQMLSFLQIGRRLNPGRFSTIYDVQKLLLSSTVIVPIRVDNASDQSYFKFNLNYINLYNLVRLENGSFGSIYKTSYDSLRDHTRTHQNAFFNVIDLALNGPDAARDAETLALLEGWLLRQKRDHIKVLNEQVPVCGDRACNPIPIHLRPPTDFIWQRDPFQLSGGLYGTIATPGIDYILPYWMARYYGLKAEFEVQSGASAAITAIAPGSIATIRGAELSGDVSITVTDSAGASRSAQVLQASSVDVNFLVPAESATGVAQITVHRSDKPALTAPARIRGAAPALFSADGSGNGVAFATLANGSPLYQCDGGGCYFVPIDMSGEEPVTLVFSATGTQGLLSTPDAVVTINGVRVSVQEVVQQPGSPGTDLLVVALPAELRGVGEAVVVITVDSHPSNPVTVYIG